MPQSLLFIAMLFILYYSLSKPPKPNDSSNLLKQSFIFPFPLNIKLTNKKAICLSKVRYITILLYTNMATIIINRLGNKIELS